MTDHTWVEENAAAYLAGGLSPDERADLERHLAGCPACTQTLEDTRRADARLLDLFAGVGPTTVTEERVIHSLRIRPACRFRYVARAFKVTLAAASVLLMVATGATVSALIDQDGPGLPDWWPGPLAATNSLKQIGIALYDDSGLLRDGDGLAGGDEPALRLPEALAEELNLALLGQDVPSSGEDRTYLGLPATDGRFSEMRRRDRLADGDSDRRNKELDDLREPTFTDSLAREKKESVTYSPDGTRLPPADAPPTVWFENGARGQGGRAAGQGGAASRYFHPANVFAGRTISPPKSPSAGLAGIEGREEGERLKRLGGLQKSDDQLAQAKEPQAAEAKPPAETAAPAGRKIIRSGEMDFEVEEFDAAVATVTRLVNATKGAYVDTVNSEKLPNGKVKGAVAIRVPPDQLDKLVLELRQELGKKGELLGQRIGSQDITKQYTDLESRLRAGRTMEERLLKIIKDGKGEIKDLLQAEKELGVWRTKIEEIEGELRYYTNLVTLSRLEVRLTEKEIRQAALIHASERVQAGIEVEDVEKAMRDALAAVEEVEGRVTRSELKQHAAGQYNAVLHFEVKPDAAGPLRDRLKQLGHTARLEIDRVEQTEDGRPAPADGKVKRGDTQFQVSLYNLANVAPRETVMLRLAAADVPAAFRTLREAAANGQGRVVNAQLNEQDRRNINAQIDFHVRRDEEAAILTALAGAGEVLSRQVARVPEGENVTDAKVLYNVALVPADAIPPRETVKLAVEVADVEGALALAATRVKDAGGRVVESQVGQERSGQVTARVVLDVPLSAAAGLVEQMKGAGTVRVQQVARDPQAPEGKLALARVELTLSNAELLLPRDEGLWAQIRHGLQVSLRGLSMSVSWLIVAVLFVLPWALLLYAIVWLFRRAWGRRPRVAVETPAATNSAGTSPGGA